MRIMKRLRHLKKDILEKTRIEYNISGEEYMLCYQTTDGRRIKLDYRSGNGFVNDVCADFADADVIASPYVTCSGGIARLLYQDKSYEVRLK